MSRNAVAVSASVLFVVLAAILVLTPAPYVTWRPGTPVNVLGSTDSGPIIDVTGTPTYDSTGQLLLTIVSTSKASSNVSLPEAMMVYFAEHSDAMPRDLIYPPGKSGEEVTAEAVASMDTSRSNAIVAALRAAGISVVEHPMVANVVMSGPAGGRLMPGDLITAVNGQSVDATAEVARIVSSSQIGGPVTFEVLRDGEEQSVSVNTTSSSQDSGRAMVGVGLGIGYEYAPTVSYGLSDEIVGPSAGLVFALGIYDRVTEGELFADRIVAGTGEIDPSGQVRSIGGVREKIKGAEDADATVFLMPPDNCETVGDLETDVQLVPVATLRDAIAALQFIAEGNEAEVPSCD
ncbi:MAG: PDZ domain-containing protein [Propionibacterium sp.]|nr:PDZ domain-containing protein [Propionibacterium sp.]